MPVRKFDTITPPGTLLAEIGGTGTMWDRSDVDAYNAYIYRIDRLADGLPVGVVSWVYEVGGAYTYRPIAGKLKVAKWTGTAWNLGPDLGNPRTSGGDPTPTPAWSGPATLPAGSNYSNGGAQIPVRSNPIRYGDDTSWQGPTGVWVDYRQQNVSLVGDATPWASDADRCYIPVVSHHDYFYGPFVDDISPGAHRVCETTTNDYTGYVTETQHVPIYSQEGAFTSIRLVDENNNTVSGQLPTAAQMAARVTELRIDDGTFTWNPGYSYYGYSYGGHLGDGYLPQGLLADQNTNGRPILIYSLYQTVAAWSKLTPYKVLDVYDPYAGYQAPGPNYIAARLNLDGTWTELKRIYQPNFYGGVYQASWTKEHDCMFVWADDYATYHIVGEGAVVSRTITKADVFDDPVSTVWPEWVMTALSEVGGGDGDGQFVYFMAINQSRDQYGNINYTGPTYLYRYFPTTGVLERVKDSYPIEAPQGGSVFYYPGQIATSGRLTTPEADGETWWIRGSYENPYYAGTRPGIYVYGPHCQGYMHRQAKSFADLFYPLTVYNGGNRFQSNNYYRHGNTIYKVSYDGALFKFAICRRCVDCSQAVSLHKTYYASA